MGRRPNTTTKTGRFMNPADQQRKIDRSKELKRNRRQRNAVRHAILKNRDADELIDQLRKIDEMEMDGEGHLRSAILSKREKVRKLYGELREFFQNDNDTEKVREMDMKMHGYELERQKKMQQIAAIQFSMNGDLEDIPMPDGLGDANAAMTPYTTSFAADGRAGLPPPRPPTFRRVHFKSTRVPGPPIGVPPELSDSESDDEYDGRPLHDEDNYDPVMIPRGLEGGEEGGSRRDPAPIPPLYTHHNNLANAPPVHPSMLQPPPRMPLRMPPPPPPGMMGGRAVHADPSATISAAPQVAKPPVPASEAVISAKPEIRDLTRESVKFVPSHLRVKRPEKAKKFIPRTNAMGMTSESAGKKSAKTTDDAYADFMKEIDGI